MKAIASLCLLLAVAFSATAQEPESDMDTIYTSIGKRLFLPSLEFGFVHFRSDELSWAVQQKAGIEFRISNNNEGFFRLNYDVKSSHYKLDADNVNSVIEGRVRFTDIILGLGFRFGDRTTRFFALAQGGLTNYSFPTAWQEGNTIMIADDQRWDPVTRVTVGAEYYLDRKTAITLELIQNEVWTDEGFFRQSASSYAISLGIIAAMF